jgi:hypothetical protein
MSNEYYEEQWQRFRKSYDVKNKYHYSIGKDSNFQDHTVPESEWDTIPIWLQNIMRLQKKSSINKQ